MTRLGGGGERRADGDRRGVQVEGVETLGETRQIQEKRLE